MDLINPDNTANETEKRTALRQRNTVFAFERMCKAGTLATFELPVYLNIEDAAKEQSRIGVIKNITLTRGGLGTVCTGTFFVLGDPSLHSDKYPTIVTYRGLPKCMVLIDKKEL